MTDKIKRRNAINLRLYGVVFFSLFILTQCTRSGTSRLQQRAQDEPQQGYQQPYIYQPSQGYNNAAGYNNPYSSAPNSRVYSNPYDFTPGRGQKPTYDNDQDYVIPSEYYPK